MTPPSGISLIDRAANHSDRAAIVAREGAFTYRQLLEVSGRVASGLLDGQRDLNEGRVAFLVPSGFDYAAIQWGIWRAGGMAVPLCTQHPPPELEYVLEDAQVGTVVAHPEFSERLQPLAEKRGLRFLQADQLTSAHPLTLPLLRPDRRALMLYTSGTTSKPKGVVTTHRNIEAQIATLVAAWEVTAEDRTLHVLPLHHIHGIINILGCSLWSGATCEMMRAFDAAEVWARFARGGITSFMAVPTIYTRLIAAWNAAPPAEQRLWSESCRRMRLMVSGSAALPVQTLETWKAISGHILLERYGMTEIGMALSNPLHGQRIPGHVGAPLGGVQVRLVDESGGEVAEGEPGEIQVRGPGVFLEYWNRPEATRSSFSDGWFKTGDVAMIEGGSYRILGRKSVDIIKTGGYKVSALEIEEMLRTHPAVQDCAVVGVADAEWGERVCAALVLRAQESLTLDDLRRWGKERLAPYKVPTRIRLLSELPHNTMGKITKPEIVKLFQG